MQRAVNFLSGVSPCCALTLPASTAQRPEAGLVPLGLGAPGQTLAGLWFFGKRPADGPSASVAGLQNSAWRSPALCPWMDSGLGVMGDSLGPFTGQSLVPSRLTEAARG